jgi:hypothetical protein
MHKTNHLIFILLLITTCVSVSAKVLKRHKLTYSIENDKFIFMSNYSTSKKISNLFQLKITDLPEDVQYVSLSGRETTGIKDQQPALNLGKKLSVQNNQVTVMLEMIEAKNIASLDTLSLDAYETKTDLEPIAIYPINLLVETREAGPSAGCSADMPTCYKLNFRDQDDIYSFLGCNTQLQWNDYEVADMSFCEE